MKVTVEVHADRLEFSGSGERVTVRLIEPSTGDQPWMTEFRMTADLMKQGLVKIGAVGLQPMKPHVRIVLADRPDPLSNVEKSALEAAALIGGAGAVTVESP